MPLSPQLKPHRSSRPAARGCINPRDLHHLVVVGHPAQDSFNHALAQTYVSSVEDCGQTARIHDLYACGFDPLLKASERAEVAGYAPGEDVRSQIAELERAHVVVLVYPIWFGMPPAIITGYVDRVLGAGLTPTAIRHSKPHSLLAGKRLVILTTSGATLPWLAERGQWYGLKEAFDFYLESIFSFASCEHEHFDSITRPLAPIYAAECQERCRQRAITTSAAVLSAAHAAEKVAKLSLFTASPVPH